MNRFGERYEHERWAECCYCGKTIYQDAWNRWKHWSSGYILCQPDEQLPGFSGVEGATPEE